MPSSVVFNLMEACREAGCPICRLQQQSVERYLDNQFYEHVNSPRWRDGLRASLGFCHEHAWLGVERRLGDALGYSIIYHDLVNSVLNQLQNGGRPSGESRRQFSFLRQLPESARAWLQKVLEALMPRKRCPVCVRRDETTRTLLSTLVEEMKNPDVAQALSDSHGLCLPHLRAGLEHAHDVSACERLVEIHREKLESLKSELAEFIRKNDYQAVHEGFGKEGDAWLRAVSLIVGSRKH